MRRLRAPERRIPSGFLALARVLRRFRSSRGSSDVLRLGCAIVILLFAGCGERERLTDPTESEGSFTLGPRTTYAIPSGTDAMVPDSISGGVFVFAAGGGTLEVARIRSGPAPSAPGTSFWVDYAGSSRVEMEFPDQASQVEILYGYGVDLGSIDDATGRAERWTCVPVAESLRVGPEDRRVRYELILPFVWNPAGVAAEGSIRTGARLSPLSTHVGFNAYHLGLLTPQSTSVQRHEAAKRQAWAFLSTVIDSLPPSLGAYVATQTASGATYEPTFYNSDDHKYKGFVYISSLFPITSSMIFLGPASTEHSVAHEMGHWVNHILAGDQRYLVLEAQAPDDHAVGDPHPGRSSVMEDYAHFLDYFCTGSLVNSDPEEPWQLFNQYSGSIGLSPSGVDWPSLEGFGTVLLASLVRRSPTIQRVNAPAEDIPVIGAKFREVLPLLASGAPSINALRDSVEAFLGRRGQRALMPALGERIGWRYNGRGRLVDGDGQPVKNARMQSVYNDGSRTWRTPGTTTTDNDGRFSLSRLFPGDGQLRVWQGTDSSDVDVPLGWSAPTDQERNLGEITVDSSVLAQLQQTLFVDVRFDGEMHMSDGSTQTSFLLTTFESYNGGSRPVWNGTSFDLEFSRTFTDGSQTQTLTGLAGSSGREILSLTAIDVFTNAYGSYRREFTLTGLEIEAGNIQPDRLWYSLEGPSVENHLSALVSTFTPASGSAVSIVSINWESEENPPKLSLEFKTE